MGPPGLADAGVIDAMGWFGALSRFYVNYATAKSKGQPTSPINDSISGSNAYTCEADSYPDFPASYFPSDTAEETKNNGEPEERRCVAWTRSPREVAVPPNNHYGDQKNDCSCKIWHVLE